jgi:uncharacterized protein (TIGR03067 family)
MRFSIALVGILALTARAADTPLPKELADIQGVWQLTDLDTGKDAGPAPVPYRWHIQGNKINYGGQELATVTLDPKSKPASIDLAFVNPKRTLEGIYSQEGDTLRICVNRRSEGVKERPREFSTKDQDDFRMLTFTRLKGEKVDPLEGLTGYIGVQLRKGEDDKEVVVVDAFKDGPAAKAGVKKDDVLLKVNGNEAQELRKVIDAVRAVKPGNNLTLRVRRDDKEVDVTIKAGIIPFFVLD